MSLSEYISPLIGRTILAWFFIGEALAYGGRWDASVQAITAHHIPAASFFLAAAIVVMLLGGLSLALGYQTRHGALLLFAFTIVVSVAMEDFWNVGDAGDRSAAYEIFARNMAVAGALLFLVGMGSGPVAIDGLSQKKR